MKCQLASTVSCQCRGLRLLSGKAAAIGVGRLWSAVRITLTDIRRSMLIERLMQLLQSKLNMLKACSRIAHSWSRCVSSRLQMASTLEVSSMTLCNSKRWGAWSWLVDETCDGHTDVITLMDPEK
jgi:hypothetical protein